MTARTATAVVRAAYEAFNTRDVEAGVALMADDVAWPNLPEGGVVRGRDGVRAHWREQFEAVDPHIELLGVDSDGDGHVRASVRLIVRSHDGTIMSDDRATHVYTMRAGLIQSMDAHG